MKHPWKKKNRWATTGVFLYWIGARAEWNYWGKFKSARKARTMAALLNKYGVKR